MSSPAEEDKHVSSKPSLMQDCETEEVKERPKRVAKTPEEDVGELKVDS